MNGVIFSANYIDWKGQESIRRPRLLVDTVHNDILTGLDPNSLCVNPTANVAKIYRQVGEDFDCSRRDGAVGSSPLVHHGVGHSAPSGNS